MTVYYNGYILKISSTTVTILGSRVSLIVETSNPRQLISGLTGDLKEKRLFEELKKETV